MKTLVAAGKITRSGSEHHASLNVISSMHHRLTPTTDFNINLTLIWIQEDFYLSTLSFPEDGSIDISLSMYGRFIQQSFSNPQEAIQYHNVVTQQLLTDTYSTHSKHEHDEDDEVNWITLS